MAAANRAPDSFRATRLTKENVGIHPWIRIWPPGPSKPTRRQIHTHRRRSSNSERTSRSQKIDKPSTTAGHRRSSLDINHLPRSNHSIAGVLERQEEGRVYNERAAGQESFCVCITSQQRQHNERSSVAILGAHLNKS
jgi:hypothetical protein